MRRSVVPHRPALTEAVEKLSVWRSQIEREVAHDLQNITAEEEQVRLTLTAAQRQLNALGRLRREQETRQADLQGELRQRAWALVLKSATTDRQLLLQRSIGALNTPAGIGLVVASSPPSHDPRIVLWILPIPFSVYKEWNLRSPDLCSAFCWRVCAAFFKLLRQWQVFDAPLQAIDLEGNLGLQTWIKGPLPDDLQDQVMEAIQSLQAACVELEEVGLELYGFWLQPDLLDPGSGL